MFKGTYPHKIDPKGRLPVPAPFRRRLAEQGAAGVVLTVLDQCLAAYPPGEWRRLEEHLRGLPTFSRTTKALSRLLASRAVDCEMDGQGRILIPPNLRTVTKLGRDALVVGVLDRFEIWAPDAWETFVTESERLLDDVSFDVPLPLASLSAATPSPAAEPGGPRESRLPQRKPKH